VHLLNKVDSDRLVDRIRFHAKTSPDRPALVYLDHGEREKMRWTFGELDRRARAIAETLSASTPCERPVLLMFPSGLEFIAAFCGCLYAGRIAVPVTPATGGAATRRLFAIAAAARPAAILSTHGTPGVRDAAEMAAAGLSSLPVIFVDGTSGEGTKKCDGAPDELVAGDIAFIQYTSGTTSVPKGVVVTQDALSANLAMLTRAWGINRDSRFVSWLPLHHDMGLIGVVLASLWSGALAVLMSPLAFLHDPAHWLAAIGRYRATISGGPNFAFDLSVRRCSSGPGGTFDLSSWQVAFCGSEQVRAATMEAFATAFEPHGFRASALSPGYGLAEATLFVTSGDIGDSIKTIELAPDTTHGGRGQPRLLVSCGKVWDDQSLLIVDPQTRQSVPDGKSGEIWIRGSHVADGYWDNQEATEETFHATLAGTTEPWFLRTGDLGLLDGGELYFVSRLKDLLVVRGVSIDPADVENTIASSHPALAPTGAVFAVEVGDEEQVVAVFEVARHTSEEALAAAAAAAFKAVNEDHGIRLYDLLLVRAGSVARTTSGKVQRHRCRGLYLSGAMSERAVAVDYRWLGKHRRKPGTGSAAFGSAGRSK
jgi:acyl-CoA synthetase (AMP-forming)/AMP-acid ligase II